MARRQQQAKGDSATHAGASHDQTNVRPRQRGRGCPTASAVKVRRMTQEEERQLEAVLDLFLHEIVREHFERQ
jgi:hypothetical protein